MSCVEWYDLDLVRQAQQTILAMSGENILGKNGQPIVADGETLKYFSAGQKQFQDSRLFNTPYSEAFRNGLGGSRDEIIKQFGSLEAANNAQNLDSSRASIRDANLRQYDQNRTLTQFSTVNGSADPSYLIENSIMLLPFLRPVQAYRLLGRTTGTVAKWVAGVTSNALKFGAREGEVLLANSGGGKTIYTVTENLSDIYNSGRVWGQTEGSVYGMTMPNAPTWRTMANPKTVDAGTIIFQGQAAELFSPHPIEGIYSGMKNALGQNKAGFGDIVFDQSTAVFNPETSTLIINTATLGEHAGQSSAWAASKLWGRRFMDLGMTTGASGLIYHYSKPDK